VGCGSLSLTGWGMTTWRCRCAWRCRGRWVTTPPAAQAQVYDAEDLLGDDEVRLDWATDYGFAAGGAWWQAAGGQGARWRRRCCSWRRRSWTSCGDGRPLRHVADNSRRTQRSWWRMSVTEGGAVSVVESQDKRGRPCGWHPGRGRVGRAHGGSGGP
jgi:hypothetical protein